ncbi:MAG: hypothetical protein ACE5F1_23115 [Planctomycetota bacterium]
MDPSIQELLDRLCCPVRHVPLRPATRDEVARINADIAAGKLLNVAGETVTEPIEDCLVRQGDDVGYPVRRGIPILIPEEGLVLT